ncbi:MAG: metallophosphoesterase [Acidobacteriota bacterium]
MNRRRFLHQTGLSALGLWAQGATRPVSAQGVPSQSWSFVHFTDVHVQPELRAAEGYRQAVQAINRLKPTFAIAGGDLIFDGFEVGFERADMLYNLYSQITSQLDMPVHSVIGNHDLFGVRSQPSVPADHPEFGKKMFSKRIGGGRTYRSFDFQDWHFVLLDSIHVTSESDYEGRIDTEQFEWLANDLRSVGRTRPVVLATHIPFFSILGTLDRGPTQPVPPGHVIVNTKEVLDLCADYNVRLMLQGHLHIVENHEYKQTRYVTSGAVCGNWWKGYRRGHPEGFALYRIEGETIHFSYHSYGWKAQG